MVGLKQIGQFRTTGDDGRAHVVRVYRETSADNVSWGSPYMVTGDGREVAPIREGVFRVYGTGLTLRGNRPGIN